MSTNETPAEAIEVRLRAVFADAVQEQFNNARGNVRKVTLDRLLDTLALHLDARHVRRVSAAEQAVASGDVPGVLRFAARAAAAEGRAT